MHKTKSVGLWHFAGFTLAKRMGTSCYWLLLSTSAPALLVCNYLGKNITSRFTISKSIWRTKKSFLQETICQSFFSLSMKMAFYFYFADQFSFHCLKSFHFGKDLLFLWITKWPIKKTSPQQCSVKVGIKVHFLQWSTVLFKNADFPGTCPRPSESEFLRNVAQTLHLKASFLREG